MSKVPLACPTCGGKVKPTSIPQEYSCENCGARFVLVRPSDGTVVTDIKTHYCPVCGKPVSPTHAYKCTECGKTDFCETHISTIQTRGISRYVCPACKTRLESSFAPNKQMVDAYVHRTGSGYGGLVIFIALSFFVLLLIFGLTIFRP